MYTSARYNIKHIALITVLSIFVNIIIYNILSSNSIKLPCTSRAECYEKAIKAGGFSSRTSSFKTRMSAFRETASRRQEDKQRISQNVGAMSDGQIKDGNVHDILHAVDQHERVKAAFVVLVRNRELDDLRSSMRYFIIKGCPELMIWMSDGFLLVIWKQPSTGNITIHGFFSTKNHLLKSSLTLLGQ